MAHRRMRARVNWAVRWGGLAAVALVLVLYVVSWGTGWFITHPFQRGGSRMVLWRGQFSVFIDDAPPGRRPVPWGVSGLSAARMLKVHWRAFPLSGRFVTEHYPGFGTSWDVRAPLWPLACAAAVGSFIGWRRRQRLPAASCPSCNYDLSGLPPGSPPLPCPECGAKSPALPHH